MKAQPSTAGSASPALPSPGVKVLMMYEDLDTGNRVMRLLDSLLHHCGGDIPFHSDMWKFDTLRCPSISKLAAEDACHADILIISAHGSEELPEEFKTWFQQWAGRRASHPAALVALLDHADGLLPQFDPTHCYLEQVARQAHMDFIPVSIRPDESEMSIRRACCAADEAPALLEAFCRRIARANKLPPERAQAACL